MKNLLLGLALILIIGLFAWQSNSQQFGGSDFSYVSPTSATSSVGIYTHASVLVADSGRSYASFCNNSIISNDAVYLQFGATSTVPSGYRLASGQCFELTLEKMFMGTVYARASTATTTLLIISK